MSASAYAKHLEQSVQRGLEINSKLERRQVSGVWGMYARASIVEGELLVRLPKSALLQPDPAAYGAQLVSASVQMIHAAAREAQQGPVSSFAYLFDLHEPLEQLKQYSIYFYGEDELNILRKLSPHLADVVWHEKLRLHAVVKGILFLDPALSESVVIATLLNFFSRAMGNNGFVPVLDCFNHSTAKGSFIDDRDGDTKYLARVAYAPDEQVYGFYGGLDLYDHAINYNYYDPADDHVLRFGRREFIPLLNESAKQIYQRFAQQYGTQLVQVGRQQFFCFKDADALLGAAGPAPRLQQLLVDYGVRANDARQPRQILKDTLSAWLDALDQGNRVDLFKTNPLPASSGRFYDVLKKEKALIALGRQWLLSC